MPRVIKPRVLVNAAIIAFLLGVGPAATAQSSLPPAPVQVAQPNAALAYWAAWANITPAMSTKNREVEWAKAGAETTLSSMPESYTRAAEEGLIPIAENLVLASALTRCDFEIRYNAGFMALLPHLSHMRDGARLLRVAAREKLIEGDADTAAKYVATMARCAGHTGGDRVLISSLVGCAIATSACEEAGVVLRSPKLSAAGRDGLLAALRSLDTPDPMNIRSSLAFEGRVIPHYLESTYRGPTSGREVAKLLEELNQPGPESAKALGRVRAMDEAGLKTELARVSGVYEEIYEAWNIDADASKLRAINEKVVAGEHGPLAQVLCPAVEKSFASAQKVRATLRETMASASK